MKFWTWCKKEEFMSYDKAAARLDVSYSQHQYDLIHNIKILRFSHQFLTPGVSFKYISSRISGTTFKCLQQYQYQISLNLIYINSIVKMLLLKINLVKYKPSKGKISFVNRCDDEIYCNHLKH